MDHRSHVGLKGMSGGACKIGWPGCGEGSLFLAILSQTGKSVSQVTCIRHQNNEKEQKDEEELGQMSKKRAYITCAIFIWVIGSLIIALLLWQMYSPKEQTFGNFPDCNPGDHGDCPYLKKQNR